MGAGRAGDGRALPGAYLRPAGPPTVSATSSMRNHSSVLSIPSPSWTSGLHPSSRRALRRSGRRWIVDGQGHVGHSGARASDPDHLVGDLKHRVLVRAAQVHDFARQAVRLYHRPEAADEIVDVTERPGLGGVAVDRGPGTCLIRVDRFRGSAPILTAIDGGRCAALLFGSGFVVLGLDRGEHHALATAVRAAARQLASVRTPRGKGR